MITEETVKAMIAEAFEVAMNKKNVFVTKKIDVETKRLEEAVASIEREAMVYKRMAREEQGAYSEKVDKTNAKLIVIQEKLSKVEEHLEETLEIYKKAHELGAAIKAHTEMFGTLKEIHQNDNQGDRL